MRDPAVSDIDLLVIMAESDAVRLEGIIGDLAELACLRVDPVDRLLLIRLDRAVFGPLSLVEDNGAIARIGKPDRAVVGMDDDIVGAIQRFAVGLFGKNRDRPVMFVANQTRSLAGNLPSLGIEGVA